MEPTSRANDAERDDAERDSERVAANVETARWGGGEGERGVGVVPVRVDEWDSFVGTPIIGLLRPWLQLALTGLADRRAAAARARMRSSQVPAQFCGGVPPVPTQRSTTRTAHIHAPTMSGTAMSDPMGLPSRVPPTAQMSDPRTASRQRGPNVKFEFNLSMPER
jgi:hypothetical protein